MEDIKNLFKTEVLWNESNIFVKYHENTNLSDKIELLETKLKEYLILFLYRYLLFRRHQGRCQNVYTCNKSMALKIRLGEKNLVSR